MRIFIRTGYWNMELNTLNQCWLYLEGVIPLRNLYHWRYTPGTIHVEPTNKNRKLAPVAGHTKTNANGMEIMATGPTTSYLSR